MRGGNFLDEVLPPVCVTVMPRMRSSLGIGLEGKLERFRLALIQRRWVPTACAVQWDVPVVQRDTYSRPITVEDPPLPTGIWFVAVDNGVIQPHKKLFYACLHSCEHFCPKCRVRRRDIYSVDGRRRILTRCGSIVWNHLDTVLGPGVESVCPNLEQHVLESHEYMP